MPSSSPRFTCCVAALCTVLPLACLAQEDTPPDPPEEPAAAVLPLRPRHDADEDLVADAVDNCPRQSGPRSNQGCPDTVPQLVAITPLQLEIHQRTFFAQGEARLLPGSSPVLTQVASVLLHHPELNRVFIEGHTDSLGTPRANRFLSLARARAVRLALIRRGVEPSRLVTVGRGQDALVASNSTAKGREQNRRMEFHLINLSLSLVSELSVGERQSWKGGGSRARVDSALSAWVLMTD